MTPPVDPSTPYGRFVVNATANFCRMPFAALANQAKEAFGPGPDGQYGDPMIGVTVGGIKWVDMTQCQQLIWLFFEAPSQKMPDDLADILKANAGPNAPWNWSYTQWGLTVAA